MAELENHSSLFYWLALERVPGVGPLSIARLIKAFGTPGKALSASQEEIRERAGLSRRAAENIGSWEIHSEKITKDIQTLRDIGASILPRWDPAYPENLQEIYDPPALLFVRGDFNPQDMNSVAIVGTRNPTHYGIEITQSITRDLVQAGITIVSGLARGIDTAAHWTAVRNGGRTIGVLGCGIDICYPRENRELVDAIIQNGAVISEFRPGISPLATNFYRRNRIVSGLTKGTLVVEAAPRSGSLITAAHALDQNREVFALPGSVLNKRSWGPHHLLKEGAALVESAEDIISTLFSSSTKKTAGKEPQNEQAELQDLTEAVKAVFEAIDIDPVHIDSLCETLGIDAGRLSGMLLELELRGLIRQHPGKMFSRIIL